MIVTRSRRLARALIFAALAAGLLAPGAAAGSGYADLRAAAVKRCQAIDPSEYQSGLVFNPEGLRSFYVRSTCFQETAVKFRDESLCEEVRERWSLFFSSWGYSGKRCRQLVEEGVAADRKVLEEEKRRFRQGAVKLRDFRIERNGNGHDFDIVPAFEAGEAHGYTLRFEIEERPGDGVLLHASGFHLGASSNIRIFVRQADIRRRVSGFEPGRRYRVRAVLTYGVAAGSAGAMWSDAFIERVFPAAERTQSLVKDVAF